jgi:hypothetical protein
MFKLIALYPFFFSGEEAFNGGHHTQRGGIDRMQTHTHTHTLKTKQPKIK